jgi:hypothetical protein
MLDLSFGRKTKEKNGGRDVAKKSFVLLSAVPASALARAQQSQSAVAGSRVGGFRVGRFRVGRSRPDRDPPRVGDALTYPGKTFS